MFDEPHLRPEAGSPRRCHQCGYDRVGIGMARCPECGAPAHDVEHAPWDEPALRDNAAAAAPEGAVTYARWLAEKIAATPASMTWATTILIAMSAGPLGVIGAFWGSGESSFSVVAIVVIGPVIEEVSKVMAATYVVEKRPYLFARAGQILLCCAAGGLAFAVIENILYLYVYYPRHEPWLWAWRWTVCTALHTGCSLITGLGLARVWSGAMAGGVAPDLSRGTRFLVGAIVLHGVYNALAVMMAMAGV